MENELKYKINATQSLSIEPEVYQHLISHRQLSNKQEEAGGQLFAQIDRNNISIKKATGPNNEDKRGRFSFLPSIFSQRREIKYFYAEGLYYVGDWHTHPEPFPTPSAVDISSMQKAFKKSKHDLQWFIMIIVGQAETANGMSISIINATEYMHI